MKSTFSKTALRRGFLVPGEAGGISQKLNAVSGMLGITNIQDASSDAHTIFTTMDKKMNNSMEKVGVLEERVAFGAALGLLLAVAVFFAAAPAHAAEKDMMAAEELDTKVERTMEEVADLQEELAAMTAEAPFAPVMAEGTAARRAEAALAGDEERPMDPREFTKLVEDLVKEVRALQAKLAAAQK